MHSYLSKLFSWESWTAWFQTSARGPTHGWPRRLGDKCSQERELDARPKNQTFQTFGRSSDYSATRQWPPCVMQSINSSNLSHPRLPPWSSSGNATAQSHQSITQFLLVYQMELKVLLPQSIKQTCSTITSLHVFLPNPRSLTSQQGSQMKTTSNICPVLLRMWLQSLLAWGQMWHLARMAFLASCWKSVALPSAHLFQKSSMHPSNQG